jgi:hypothetical protein
MIVNLKTAKALGLAVPPSILLRAREAVVAGIQAVGHMQRAGKRGWKHGTGGVQGFIEWLASPFNFVWRPCLRGREMHTEDARRILRFPRFGLGPDTARIEQKTDRCGRGQDFVQQFKTLRGQSRGEEAHARDVATRTVETRDFAASTAAGLPTAMITSTRWRTRSAASAGKRS